MTDLDSLPQRPMSHEAGDYAVRFFTAQCPSAWIVSPVQPDYGLDLRVETCRDGLVTGHEFYVQVKGTRHPVETSALHASVKIEQSTINYWLGKLRPVLVVLVEVDAGRMWFEWLEDSYVEYPRQIAQKRSVTLTLQLDDDQNSFVDRVLPRLDTFYTHLLSDLSSAFDSTQLTRLLYHTSALFRFGSSVALHLRRADETVWRQFEGEFDAVIQTWGLRDRWLCELWRHIAAAEEGLPEQLVSAIGSKMDAYLETRALWFGWDVGENTADGCWRAVPVSFPMFIEHFISTVITLNELEDVLLDALVLGKTEFGRSA